MELKIHSNGVIGNVSKFESHSQWYYIDNKGTIKDFIVNSGLSSSSAEILAGIYKYL